ncbi:MAG: sugar phosphate nucleotidyltransferase [Bryobacteraceae bacterium]
MILAGGDGTRLQHLTARIEGDTRPKQFCRMFGEDSLLMQTRRRISPLVDDGNILTVVTKKHEPYYSRELSACPATHVVVQPENRGTGVAIAMALLTLRELDSEAIVATLPADHHYSDEGAFLQVMEAALQTAADDSDKIILVGAEATYPETEYGWIEPVWNQAGLAPAGVRQFWEKPDLATARDLLRTGCLWNTFVTIGRVSAFIDILCQEAPNTMLLLSAGIAEGDVSAAYKSIRPIDFCRDVLASRPHRLRVIRDRVSGWTDLGNPDRLFAMLARERITPRWLEPASDFGGLVTVYS